MRILKPTWVRHGSGADSRGSPVSIYSVDLHPDGSCFATGGATELRIWDARALQEDLNGSLAGFDKSPSRVEALRASLTSHSGDVYCVRFSSSGHYLASASADNAVRLWRRSSQEQTPQTDSTPRRSDWESAYLLTGHNADVKDLSWSPDDTRLASCSLDSSVLVWQLTALSRGITLTPVARLQHETYVNGVAWDPVGRFIASSSDDGVLRIWRDSDRDAVADSRGTRTAGHRWTKEADIVEHLKEYRVQTFFRRISWAPDGMNLCATNALKDSMHAAALFHRESWKVAAVLHGHKGAVVVARWSPRLYALNDASDTYTRYVAVGSCDHSVTIWADSRPEPVCTIVRAFTNSISDICWGSDGLTVLVVSHDGTLCACQLSTKELGIPRPKDFALGVIMKKHSINPRDGREEPGLVENVTQLRLEARGSKGAGRLGQKKRITPTLISVAPRVPNGHPAERVPNGHPAVQNGRPKKRRRSLEMIAPLGGAIGVPPRLIGSNLQRRSSQGRRSTSRYLYTASDDTQQSYILECGDADNSNEAASGHYDSSGSRDGCITRTVARVIRTGSTKPVWETLLSSSVTCCDGGRQLTVLGCQDGSLHFFQTTTGMKLLPPVIVGRCVAGLCCKRNNSAAEAVGGFAAVAAISTDGFVHVWDGSSLRSQLRVSASEIIQSMTGHGVSEKAEPKGPALLYRICLSARDEPILVLGASCGANAYPDVSQTFLFNKEVGSWLRVADSNFEQSDFASPRLVFPESLGPLSKLQIETLRTSNVQRAHLQPSCQVTEVHLEDRLVCALAMDSGDEFKGWMHTYVKFLAEQGKEEKLRRLFDTLLHLWGGTECPLAKDCDGSSAISCAGSPTGCWTRMHDLDIVDVLRSGLRTISEDRRLQKFVEEYHDVLNAASGNKKRA